MTEDAGGAGFGQQIGPVVFGADVHYLDFAILDRVPNKEVAKLDVFGSCVVDRIGSQGNSSLVVNVDDRGFVCITKVG